MSDEQGVGHRTFVALDELELDAEPVRSFTALQRSVYHALNQLANRAELPWHHHGRLVGVVRRGELTHDVRSISEHAKVSKDVTQGVIEALRRASLLEWVEPTSEPTREATISPTTKPASGPTRARKLRLVHYLRKSAMADEEPTSEPTTERTSHPASGPTTEPTEIRRSDRSDSQTSLLPSPVAPARAQAKRRTRTGEPDPRHRLLQGQLEAIFRDVRGSAYGFQPRDGKAIADLLRLSGGDVPEVERRWRVALTENGFRRCDSIHELAAVKWNAYAPAAAKSAADMRHTPPAAGHERFAELARAAKGGAHGF